MPIEIEAKMRLHDRAALVATLDRVGGVLVAHLLETNRYFDAQDDGLQLTDQGLRIRSQIAHPESPQATATTIITHKGPRSAGKLKAREETELVVADEADAARLLAALGLHQVLSFEKRRSRYTLDGCLIELDELPMLGHFIEIEGPSEERIFAAREKLGLAEEPLVDSSYATMLMMHLQEIGRERETICFAD